LCAGGPSWRTDSAIDGWPVCVPMMDIHTIGAGGGSIADVDAAGALMVGPRSAGSDPGPACYGRSELVTVTDANVVLGRIRPEFFLGGNMTIHPERSAAAVDRLAATMNVDRIAAATGVVRVANANMERAIKAVSAQRGHDPRAFMLVSFGGAGGLHACDLAASLRMKGVIVAANAGILSALGMLQSDVLKDYARSLPRRSGIDLADLRRQFEDMSVQALRDFQSEQLDPAAVQLQRFADMRYRGQSHELTVPIESLDDLKRLIAPFHAAHERTFGYATSEEPVEIVTLRLRCTLETSKPVLPRLSPTDGQVWRALIDTRPVHFTSVASDSAVETNFYERTKLLAGDAGTGPAVIVEAHATTLIPPGWNWRVHEAGHLICRAL